MAAENKKFIRIDDKRIKIDDIESYDIFTETLKFEKVYTNKGGLFARVDLDSALVWNGERALINEERYNDLKRKNFVDNGWSARWSDHTTYKKVFDSYGDIVDSADIYPNFECRAFATMDDVIEEEYQCLHVITSQKEYWFSEYFLGDEFEEICDKLDELFTC